MKRITAIILLLSAGLPTRAQADRAAVGAPPGAVAGPRVPATSPAIPPAPGAVEGRIAEFALLLTGNNEPHARLVGARELLTMESRSAWERLAGVLRSPESAAKLAVCQAVAATNLSRPLLLEPLIEQTGADSVALREAAAAALSRYRSPALIDRLARMAADVRSPLAQRQTCIMALGGLGDDKRAIAALIELLGDRNPEIVATALDKIDDSSDVDLPDAGSARRWWEENAALEPSAWLLRRNEQLRSRLRRTEAENGQLASRLLASLRSAYQAAPETERERLLLDLMNDPLAGVRGLGVGLVNAMITDRRPVPPGVARRVLSMTLDASPDVRRTAAAVLGDLRDRSTTPALTAALSQEVDGRVRAALVSAFGRIGGGEALSVVRARLDDASPLVVAEAAQALGSLADPNVLPREVVEEIADDLLRRYERVEAGQDVLLEAVLSAMARMSGLATQARPWHARFRSAFQEQVSADRPPGVRRAAIRGLSACQVTDPAADAGETAALLRRLSEDPSAMVRLAVVEALGRCGRSPADLNALAARLDPVRESEEPVRQKAWDSTLRVARNLPIDEQFALAAEYFRREDKTSLERHVELLTQLERRLAERPAPPPGALREGLPAALARAHALLGRHETAAAYYEQSSRALAAAEREAEATSALTDAAEELLAARNYEAVFGLLERARTESNGRTIRVDYGAVAERLEAVLTALTGQQDVHAAAELAELIGSRLGDDAALSADQRIGLEKARQRALEALRASATQPAAEPNGS